MQRFWYLFLAMFVALGCTQDEDTSTPPSDHPYYPSRLLQNADTLYVFSSNFDQRYKQANVLSIDLAAVDNAITQNITEIGTNVVTSSAFIPNFADGATLSPTNDRILYVSRGERSLRSIPLGPTNLIACPGATTALAQDCYTQSPALSLRQANPYYLTLFGDIGGLSGGVIGYLVDPLIQHVNEKGHFVLPEYFEMERFTWNAATNTADITASIGLGEKIKGPLSPTAGRRFNTRIGGVSQPIAGYQYFIAERAPEGMSAVEPFLVRVSMTDLQSAGPKAIIANTYDLTSKMGAIEGSVLAVRTLPDSMQFFLSNSILGNVFQFEMSLAQPTDANGKLLLTLKNRAELCNRPTDMKLTENQDKLIVACDNGKLLVFEAQTLRPFDIDPPFGAHFGRGPVQIHFDKRAPFSNRFYTSNFLDGSIGVFDVTDSTNPGQVVLSRKARIFQPSLPNREGGVQ